MKDFFVSFCFVSFFVFHFWCATKGRDWALGTGSTRGTCGMLNWRGVWGGGCVVRGRVADCAAPTRTNEQWLRQWSARLKLNLSNTNSNSETARTVGQKDKITRMAERIIMQCHVALRLPKTSPGLTLAVSKRLEQDASAKQLTHIHIKNHIYNIYTYRYRFSNICYGIARHKVNNPKKTR